MTQLESPIVVEVIRPAEARPAEARRVEARTVEVRTAEHQAAGATSPRDAEAAGGRPVVATSPDSWAVGDLLLVAARSVDGTHAVISRLAQAHSAKAALWRLALAAGHSPTHPAAAEAEAAAWLAAPGVDDPALVDLTHVPFVTIDNAGSRDLDQAVHVQRDGAGYRLRYALADASYYVRPGSALFAEALRRGASYYMPGAAIPMLPRCLSEGLISLNPRAFRRSVVMELRLDAEGRCVATRLLRGRICSRAKLTYAGVQAMYAAGDAHPAAHQSYAQSLDLLAEVGRLRIELARQADVVSFQRTEVDVQIDGASFSLVADRRLPIERYNEQISLLCNTEGARLITPQDGEAQGVFKVHPAPPSEKLERFVRLVDALVQTRGLERDRWRWHRGREPLADYLDRLPRAGAEARISQAIERQAMMANVGSTFADGPAPHHGVGAAAYARFSAPMREVVGVFTHKEALEQIGIESPAPRADDELLRQDVIDAANSARQRQAQLTKACNQLVLDTLLARELKMGKRQRWRTGTLLGMTATKLYLQLDAPPIEVKVYLRDLPREGARPRVCAHGGNFQLCDRSIAIGERVEVRVTGRSERSGRWVFALRFPDSPSSASPSSASPCSGLQTFDDVPVERALLAE